MKSKKMLVYLVLVFSLVVLLSACGGGATEPAAEEPTAEEPMVEEPTVEEPAMDEPTSLKVAAVLAGTLEEPWYSTSMDSLYKLQENNPYDVEIEIDYSENIWGEDSERVMREYAEAGYDLVWSFTGSDSEYIVQIQDDYPDVLFAHSGGGGTGLGKNSGWVWGFVHEPTYLMGMIAGMMTETNTIGFVGSFPSDDVNTEANSYIQGAKDINPDVEAKVSFINSWWDPDLAKEATVAQIAAGADFIYPTIFGAFEAMSEAEISGFGNYVDQSEMAPDVIVASSLLFWDPPAEWLLDLWWEHATTGNPYNVQTEGYYGLMADGGSDLSLIEEMLPADVIAAVKAKYAEIIDGSFVVEMDRTTPESD